MTKSVDFPKLIERLDKWRASLEKTNYQATAAIIAEASKAISTLTSTIAGLEVDAERLEFVLRRFSGRNARRICPAVSDTGDMQLWREAIDKMMKRKNDAAISRARG